MHFIAADGFHRHDKAEPRKQGTIAELARKQGTVSELARMKAGRGSLSRSEVNAR